MDRWRQSMKYRWENNGRDECGDRKELRRRVQDGMGGGRWAEERAIGRKQAMSR